jgi:hypothetical protein
MLSLRGVPSERGACSSTLTPEGCRRLLRIPDTGDRNERQCPRKRGHPSGMSNDMRSLRQMWMQLVCQNPCPARAVLSFPP